MKGVEKDRVSLCLRVLGEGPAGLALPVPAAEECTACKSEKPLALVAVFQSSTFKSHVTAVRLCQPMKASTRAKLC